MRLVWIGLLIVLFLFPAALADQKDVEYLSLKADRLGCAVSFHNEVMSGLALKAGYASSLNGHIEALAADQVKLKSIAESGDNREFQQFLNSNLKGDARAADNAVKEARKSLRANNVPDTVIMSLREDFKASKEEFLACKKEAGYALARKRVEIYSRELMRADAEAKRLAQLNIDVSALTALIADANATVIAPVKKSVAPGTVKWEAQDALRNYCLWNGCKDGMNYHFGFKFTIAKMQAILDAIKPAAEAKGLSAQADLIQARLSEAKTALDASGAGLYTKEQKAQISDNILAAQTELKELVRQLQTSGADR